MKKPIRLSQIYIKAVLLLLVMICFVVNARAQQTFGLVGSANPDPTPEDGKPYILDPNYLLTDDYYSYVTSIQITLKNPNAIITMASGMPADLTFNIGNTPGTYTILPVTTATTADFQLALRNLQYATTLQTNNIDFFVTDNEGKKIEYIQLVIQGQSISSGLEDTYIDDVYNISSTSATVGYSVSGPPVSADGIVYMPYQAGTLPTLSNATSIPGPLPAANFPPTNITGLQPGTEYIVAAYGTNPAGTGYSQPITFTTLFLHPVIIPTATTLKPTLVVPNGLPVIVDQALTITDGGTTNLNSVSLIPPPGATLSISGALPNGITFAANTLSGTASIPVYEGVLRNVQISTDTYSPSLGQVTLTAFDSNGASGSGALYIKTTSENGDATLSNLTFSGGALSPSFDPLTFSYTSNTLIAAQTITATTKDTLAIIKINGVVVKSGIAFPLSFNKTTSVINITITSGDDLSFNTYVLTVSNPKANNTVLENLQIDPNSELTTTFSTTTQINYTTSVDAAVTSVMIKPTTSDPGAKVTVNEHSITEGSWSSPIALNTNNTPTVIKTVVTAGNGTKKSYFVSISKNGSSNVILEGLLLNPTSQLTETSSTATQINYTASVEAATTSVAIKPIASDTTAIVTVNGHGVVSGAWSPSITLNTDGTPTVVTTLVTSGNSSQKSYVINISKKGASNLVLEGLLLSSYSVLNEVSSNPTQINYNASVNIDSTSIRIKPTASDPTANITVDGVAVVSGAWSQPVPLSWNYTIINVIRVVVTGADGEQKTYIINLSKSELGSSDVTIENLGLYGDFGESPVTETSSTPTQVTYSGTVYPFEGEVRVKATAHDRTATMTANGRPIVSGLTSYFTIPLNAVGPTPITIVVTALAGNQKSYVIMVTKTKSDSSATAALLPQQPFRLQLMTDVVVHHAVTPDGDGINDYLKIDGITQYPDNKLAIIDPSGVLIYQTKGYDNNARKFDGHSNINGKLQQPGTYYYLLDYTVNGKPARETGYFVLQY